MTEIMPLASVPDGVAYGVIRHHVTSFEGDGADHAEAPDQRPDEIPMQGQVTITPTVGTMRWPTLNPPTTAVMARIVCPVIDGDLYPPNTTVEAVTSGDAVKGVAVVATDQPSALPTRVQYRVEWNLTGARVQPPAVTIEVPANGVVDLTTVIPAQAEPGTVIVTTTETAERAEAAADRAEEAAAAAVAGVAPGPAQYLQRPSIKWLSTMAVGETPWTKPFGFGSVGYTDAVKAFGTRSLQITDSAANLALSAPVDLTQNHLVVLYRQDSLAAGCELLLQAGENNLSKTVVYSLGRAGDPSPFARDGEWVMQTLPLPVNFVGGTPDMTKIKTVRVRQLEGSGSIHLQALGLVPATPPVISISFDDGYASVLEAARQSMTPRGLAGTIYTIPGLIGTSGFMTASELMELAVMHGWDVQTHTELTSPGRENLTAELQAVRFWVRSGGFGSGDHHAWAGGQADASTDVAARKTFTSARTISSYGGETIPPPRPHRMRAVSSIGGVGGVSVADTKVLIDRTKQYGGWLHLVFHRITDAPAAPENCDWANFNTILDYIVASGIPVKTVSEALAPSGGDSSSAELARILAGE